MEKNTFTVLGDDGREITCQVLFTFESDETNKNYIVYTDGSKDAKGNTQVYASIYDPNDSETNLVPIETEKEWKIIETILTTLQEEIKNKNNDTVEESNEQ